MSKAKTKGFKAVKEAKVNSSDSPKQPQMSVEQKLGMLEVGFGQLAQSLMQLTEKLNHLESNHTEILSRRQVEDVQKGDIVFASCSIEDDGKVVVEKTASIIDTDVEDELSAMVLAKKVGDPCEGVMSIDLGGGKQVSRTFKGFVNRVYRQDN